MRTSLFASRPVVALLSLGVVLCVACSPASAGTIYGFTRFTTNGAAPTPLGQYTVEVTDGIGGMDFSADDVRFTFRNNNITGAITSYIDGVYFDDGSLLGISHIVNGPNVDFSQGARPLELPGSNLLTPVFETTAGFTADADAPRTANGVAIGEFVHIYFDLKAGKTLLDILNELNNIDSAEPELRIGLKVQGFPNGQSESYINSEAEDDTGGSVPEPASILIWSIGVIITARVRRNRQKAIA